MLAIDLAASEKRPSGYAFLEGNRVKSGVVYSDGELLSLCKDFEIIGIDAPLSLPLGRDSIEERGPHFRECDLALKAMHIPFFPISLGPMRALTKRGMKLASLLKGKKVVELFPGASLDILGIKRKDVEAVNRFLSGWGAKASSVDESDALIGLFTLWLFKQGFARLLEGRDGAIVVAQPAFPLAGARPVALFGRKSRFKVAGEGEEFYLHDTGRLEGLLEGEGLVKGSKLLIANGVVVDSCLDEVLAKGWLKIWGERVRRGQVLYKNCRFDFLLDSGFCEVKGASLLRGKRAFFPDCFSKRALKHFSLLRPSDLLVFAARGPCTEVSLNPAFPLLKKALKCRVKAFCMEVRDGFIVTKEIKYV